MSFADLSDRLSRAVMTHLSDSRGDYQGEGVTAADIPLIIDRDCEVYEEDQVAMRVTTISVRVADVPESRQGDTIALPGRTWTVQQILEDDGHLRRLYVS